MVSRKFERSRPELFIKPASKISGALWRRGGKRKESLQLRLWNLNSSCGSSSTELSDFRQSARSGNERECKHVPRVMMSSLMSSPPISISHRLFQCRYSNSRDELQVLPPFPAPKKKCPGALARKLLFMLSNRPLLV